MSEVKVNKITPTANCGTVTLGDSGDTITIPSGVTLTSAGAITNSGTITNTGTISGGTITGNIQNTVSWQTGSIKTSGFTAVAGEGYFCDTSSGAFAVTLPASPSAGNLVAIKDYSFTADTANITINRNGSNIQGNANNFVISTEGASIFLIYVDATKGWLLVGAAKKTDIAEQILFVTATGGTVTTCGDYKIHTFTGPGTFCVSCAGNPVGSNKVDYLVTAGGGGGGATNGGGALGAGGAGGYRESYLAATSGSYTASPLATPVSLSVPAQAYPITVGGGGAGGSCLPAPTSSDGGEKGSNSIFSSITSTGGGGGSAPSSCRPGGSGGSPGGSGNTPSVSPPQGNDAGVRSPTSPAGPMYTQGGGGGAGSAGSNSPPSGPGGSGGNGTTSSITGSPVTRAGGGGGGAHNTPPGNAGSGGPGGGGAGKGNTGNGVNGTANTGGGGGGTGGAGYGSGTPQLGGTGGSGIVIIRYKYQ